MSTEPGYRRSADGAAFIISAWGSAPGKHALTALSAESAIHSRALSSQRGGLFGALSRAFSARTRCGQCSWGVAPGWHGAAPLAQDTNACPARDHAFSSKPLSRMIGNCSGFSRNRASTSSNSAVSFGDGVGSRMISSHRASPSSSGTNVGNDSANRARSASGSSRIAAAISSTVLTVNSYNTRLASATPQH